jgi:hypothetical protein
MPLTRDGFGDIGCFMLTGSQTQKGLGLKSYKRQFGVFRFHGY